MFDELNNTLRNAELIEDNTPEGPPARTETIDEALARTLDRLNSDLTMTLNWSDWTSIALLIADYKPGKNIRKNHRRNVGLKLAEQIHDAQIAGLL